MKSYEELRAGTNKADHRRKFSPEVGAVRRNEQQNRSATARMRALHALARAFPDEYRTLYQAAKAEVNAERGPLPGDESLNGSTA
jgi:hypothetical protein